MKINKLLLFISIFCFTTVVFSQPLNNSFENWDGTTGQPIDWSANVPAVTQTNIAQHGSSAAHLEVIDFFSVPLIPVLQSLDASFNGHPVSEKHGSLQGWYQFMPLGSDVILITVNMLQGSSSGVGAGAITIPAATSGWTQFTVPIFYAPGSPTPDNTLITIIIADTSQGGKFGTIGSMGYIDNLSFTGPSAVEQLSGLPQDYNLSQNYPNPFNPTTNIEYSIPEHSFVDLRVYDILGNEIAVLVSAEQSAGTYRADFTGAELASGFYIARLRAGEYTNTIKMNLLK